MNSGKIRSVQNLGGWGMSWIAYAVRVFGTVLWRSVKFILLLYSMIVCLVGGVYVLFGGLYLVFQIHPVLAVICVAVILAGILAGIDTYKQLKNHRG